MHFFHAARAKAAMLKALLSSLVLLKNPNSKKAFSYYLLANHFDLL